jgi:hypothetical protein
MHTVGNTCRFSDALPMKRDKLQCRIEELYLNLYGVSHVKLLSQSRARQEESVYGTDLISSEMINFFVKSS